MQLMKKIILFLLLTLILLSAEDSFEIFKDNFGDESRVQAIGFRLHKGKDESVKILLKKENFYKGYHYKGGHEKEEYARKYLNNISINAKESQKLFIYSPAIKKCEFEFNILEFNTTKQKAKLSFSASLVGEKRALKILETQKLSIQGDSFKELLKLLKKDTFSINYQRFTNRLRNRLAQQKIKLFRGEIEEFQNYTSIHFQTDTTFEIEMFADKQSAVTALNISFKGFTKEQKESVIKIIVATMNTLSSVEKKGENYTHDAEQLLENSPNTFVSKNTQYSFSKSNFFEVLPLFNQ